MRETRSSFPNFPKVLVLVQTLVLSAAFAAEAREQDRSGRRWQQTREQRGRPMRPVAEPQRQEPTVERRDFRPMVPSPMPSERRDERRRYERRDERRDDRRGDHRDDRLMDESRFSRFRDRRDRRDYQTYRREHDHIRQWAHESRRHELRERFRRDWERRHHFYHDVRHMRRWRHRIVNQWTPRHLWLGHHLPTDLIAVGFTVSVGHHGISVAYHYKHNPYYFYDTRFYYVDPFHAHYNAYYLNDPYRHTYTPAFEGQRLFYRATAIRLAQRMAQLAVVTGNPVLMQRAMILRTAVLMETATRASTFQVYLNVVEAYMEYRADNSHDDDSADEIEGMLQAMSYQYDYALRLYE